MPKRRTYSEKLRDPRWQKKRLEIFQRDNFRCQVCGAEDQTLHVHHRRYRGEPWESRNEDLETLCESCHTKLTELPCRHVIKYAEERLGHSFRASDVLAAAELAIEKFINDEADGDVEVAANRKDFWKIDILFFAHLKIFT